jgi:hypothetical protein
MKTLQSEQDPKSGSRKNNCSKNFPTEFEKLVV